MPGDVFKQNVGCFIQHFRRQKRASVDLAEIN